MISCHEIVMLVTTGSNDFDKFITFQEQEFVRPSCYGGFSTRSGEPMGDSRGAENRTNVPLLYRYTFLAMRDMMASLR